MLRRLTSSAPWTGRDAPFPSAAGQPPRGGLEVVADPAHGCRRRRRAPRPRSGRRSVEPRVAEVRAPSSETGPARSTVRAMLRVSATACSSPTSTAPRSPMSRTRRAAWRRTFKRPLSRARRTSAQASSMPWSSARVRSTQPSGSAARRRREVAGHLLEQRAEPVVEVVDAPRRAAVAQRRPDHEVDGEAHADADERVREPCEQHRAVLAVAREQHDQRRGRGRGRLGPHRAAARRWRAPRAARAPATASPRPSTAPAREREQHAGHRGGRLLQAARHGAVHRGVDGEQRGPRRQERLREREHLDGEHPGDDRGRRRLDDLEHVGPEQRVAQAVPGRAITTVCPLRRIRQPVEAAAAALLDPWTMLAPDAFVLYC